MKRRIHIPGFTASSLIRQKPRTCLLTYLFTPWSRVLLEKLTGSAASQELPRIFGTRRFLTVPTSARHLSLSWANSIQSPQLPPTSWRSILILSSHLRLGLPNRNLVLIFFIFPLPSFHFFFQFHISPYDIIFIKRYLRSWIHLLSFCCITSPAGFLRHSLLICVAFLSVYFAPLIAVVFSALSNTVLHNWPTNHQIMQHSHKNKQQSIQHWSVFACTNTEQQDLFNLPTLMHNSFIR